LQNKLSGTISTQQSTIDRQVGCALNTPVDHCTFAIIWEPFCCTQFLFLFCIQQYIYAPRSKMATASSTNVNYGLAFPALWRILPAPPHKADEFIINHKNQDAPISVA